MIKVSIERWIETLKMFKNYDSNHEGVANSTASVINILTWVFTMGQFVLFYLTNDYKYSDKVCFCTVTTMIGNRFATLPSFTLIGFSSISAIIGCWVHKKNVIILKKFEVPANTANVLNMRYDTWVKIHTTKWFIPLAVTNAVMIASTFGLRNLFMLIVSNTPENVFLITQGLLFMLSLETLVYPLVSIR